MIEYGRCDEVIESEKSRIGKCGLSGEEADRSLHKAESIQLRSQDENICDVCAG